MKVENYFKISFPSKSVNEAFARMSVSAFCMQLDPTVEQLNDIKTAVSEAVTNCVVHGYPDSIGIIYITAQKKGEELIITIKDNGVGIPNIEQAMQPMFTTGSSDERAGLGFAVMQAFMDKIKVTSKPNKGVRVVMTKIIKQRN